MLVRPHLEAHRALAVHVDDHALDHGDDAIARQRILPGLQLRVPDAGVHQVHLADAALVLLEGGDLARVGRPLHHRAIAEAPAGVVGGVAVVLDAVGGERRFLVGGDVAHPQVPVADEHRPLAVGRQHVGPRSGAVLALARRAVHGAGVAARAGRERHRAAVGGEVDRQERQLRAFVGAARGGRQGGGQQLVIEGRRLAARHRIDDDELRPGGAEGAIPEAAVGHPVRAHAGVQHERVRVVADELLGLPVVVRGQLAGRLREHGGRGEQDHRHRDGARGTHHGTGASSGMNDTSRVHDSGR